ncbi:MAG: outer membrane beta-barrel protein [Candidatus Acidiferrum sp.]
MFRRTLFSNSILFLLCPLLPALPICAQENYTRFELGAEYSTVRETNPSLQGNNSSGFGGRFDWNLNRRLAFESQMDFFPGHGVPLLLVQGGQTLQAVFGVRAKVVQTRHFSVFGLVRPGLLHFTGVEVPSAQSSSSIIEQSATYFVLNLGGGIEYYPSPQWVLRADIEGNPYRVPAYFVSAGGGTAAQPGKINDTTRLSFGVAYRPGALIENEPEVKVPGRWEFGPLFSAMMLAREGLSDNVRSEPGFGGYASYRFFKVFYLDGDLLYFPRRPDFSGPHDGGSILQALVGLKGGIRRNHFGFFGKVRPGFHGYSQALRSITTTGLSTPVYSYGRSTTFALDLGGIVEVYPGRRSTLRVEVGDTHLFFGTSNLNIDGVIEPVSGGKMQHSIQAVLGYGWRF